MDRYNRTSARSAEKERRESKRKLELQHEKYYLQAAEALIDLSNLPGPTDYVPTVNLGYEKFKTPTMDRYIRASVRSAEKER